MSDSVETSGSAGTGGIALVHPGSDRLLQAAEVVTRRKTFHRLPCLHCQSVASTVAVSAGGNKWSLLIRYLHLHSSHLQSSWQSHPTRKPGSVVRGTYQNRRPCKEHYTDRHNYPILWQPSCRVFKVLWEGVVHTIDTRNRDVFFPITDVLQNLTSHLKCLQHL